MADEKGNSPNFMAPTVTPQKILEKVVHSFFMSVLKLLVIKSMIGGFDGSFHS